MSVTNIAGTIASRSITAAIESAQRRRPRRAVALDLAGRPEAQRVFDPEHEQREPLEHPEEPRAARVHRRDGLRDHGQHVGDDQRRQQPAHEAATGDSGSSRLGGRARRVTRACRAIGRAFAPGSLNVRVGAAALSCRRRELGERRALGAVVQLAQRFLQLLQQNDTVCPSNSPGAAVGVLHADDAALAGLGTRGVAVQRCCSRRTGGAAEAAAGAWSGTLAARFYRAPGRMRSPRAFSGLCPGRTIAPLGGALTPGADASRSGLVRAPDCVLPGRLPPIDPGRQRGRAGVPACALSQPAPALSDVVAAAAGRRLWPKDWKDTAAPVEQSVAFALYTTHAETLKLGAALPAGGRRRPRRGAVGAAAEDLERRVARGRARQGRRDGLRVAAGRGEALAGALPRRRLGHDP